MKTDEKNYCSLKDEKRREKKTNKQFHSLTHIHENHFGMLRENRIFIQLNSKKSVHEQ